jgi:FAD/FMN-containing dehydrogenase
MAPPARIPAERLRSVVGERHVVTDPDVLLSAGIDWTGRFRGEPSAIVRPGTTDEVATVVALCAAAGVTIVPQGGNTGLVGGTIATAGAILLNLGRLRRLDAVDDANGSVVAGAGITLDGLHRHVAARGWRYPVDFGAREVATVGGMIATNAGGVGVFRHGSTRQRLIGVEAVLADGEVVSRLGGLRKDSTGYDLAGLLCGSEGTLGVVTAACVRLEPAPAMVATAWIDFDDLDAAVAAARRFRTGCPELEALEVIAPECVAALAADDAGVMAGGAALLVEAAGDADPAARLHSIAVGLDGLRDAQVAIEPDRRAHLWRRRDAIPELILRDGIPLKLDVAVPPAALAEFLDSIERLVAQRLPSARLWRFGHAADGNIHLNLTGVLDESGVADATVVAAEDVIFAAVVDAGGTIAAEHGVGTAKVRWLALSRTDAERRAMGAIKAALDPDRLFNPGVLGL